MESFESIGVEEYHPADEVENLSFFQNVKVYFGILFVVLPNTLLWIISVFGLAFWNVVRAILPLKLKSIRGKVAVVTGGGNGIGREICIELATHGCHVAVLDLDVKAAEATCIYLRKIGVQAFAYKVDVSSYQEILNAKQTIQRDLGAVDILVNNAGLLPKFSLLETDIKNLEKVVQVNLLAHFWTIRVFIEDMIKKRSGHIVGVSSMLAFYPSSRTIVYTATKYGVRGLMESLARELHEDKVNVKTLLVLPHLTNTRKELMDHTRVAMGTSSIRRIGVRSPKEVAVGTVKAIRNDSLCVSIPRYALAARILQALPFRFQLLFSDIVMPKLPPPMLETPVHTITC